MEARERDRSKTHAVSSSVFVRNTASLIVGLLAGASSAHAQFSDVTGAAGIDHTHFSPDPTDEFGDLEHMTGGAAAGDFDGGGTVDGLDIDPFVQALTGAAGVRNIPEPGTLALFLLGTALCRRRTTRLRAL